jgi:hypothetical protein
MDCRVSRQCWEGYLDLRTLYKKSKSHPIRVHEVPEGEWRCRSPHSLTSALYGVGS